MLNELEMVLSVSQIEYCILIIDDDPADFELISEHLSQIQPVTYKLEWAKSFKEAQSTLEENGSRYDAVLLDYLLGGSSSLELLKNITAFDIPAIILTGKGNFRLDQQVIQMGAADYLPKDKIDSGILDLSIRHSVERKRNEILVVRQQSELNKIVKKVAMSELAATIIHEINNPLTIIQGKLLKILHTSDQQNADLEVINKCASQALEMMNRIVKIKEGAKRIYGGKNISKFETASLREIIKDAAEVAEKRLQQTGTELHVEVSEEIELQCYPVELSQTFVNLICNACDAVEPLDSREIKISAHDDGKDIHISVKDSGTPPSVTIQQHMFDDFFTTKDKGKGTGIGLSLIKRIIKWHGGSISLDSQSPNTCFLIQIPKDQKDRKKDSFQLLIVDDEVEIVDFLRDAFIAENCMVQTASNGVDAAKLIQNNSFDAVITDINMPGLDGVELYFSATNETAQGKNPPPEFIFITGGSKYSHDVLKNNRIFYKPFNIKELVNTTLSLLSSRQLELSRTNDVQGWLAN